MDEFKQGLYGLHARILKVLANPRRLMILDQLHNGDKSVSELVDLLELPQATVSQHLAVIREQGIVSAERHGNTVSYSLADTKIVQACDLFREFLLERIKNNQSMAEQFDLADIKH